jgi:hypothetical protein
MSTYSDFKPSAAAVAAAGGINPNLIINSGFTINQRAAASYTASGYNLDRWRYAASGAGTLAVSQDSTGIFAAWGSDYCMKVDVTGTDVSYLAADVYCIQQYIEAQNLQHLEYGTAGAQDLTLSFLYQSPKSGTHSVCLQQSDTSRSYPINFTVASADTPEKIEITIPGDASGVINNDNGVGLALCFPMKGGTDRDGVSGSWSAGQWYMSEDQQNLMDDVANNVYIGQVKLEVASTATAFEHESYGDTLAKCMRYYERKTHTGDNIPIAGVSCMNYSTTNSYVTIPYLVPKRTTPTIGSLTAGEFYIWNSSGGGLTCTSISLTPTLQECHGGAVVSGGGLVAGNSSHLSFKGTNKYIEIIAEL